MSYYINVNGKYLGEFENTPENSYIVPSPPINETDTWNGESWILYENMIPRPDLFADLIISDPNVPVQIIPFLSVIRTEGGNKALRQSIWIKLVVLSPEWLTVEYKEKLKGFAIECYVPLE